MRRLCKISVILTCTFTIFLYSTSFSVYADEYKKFNDKDFKFLPKYLCAFFKSKCGGENTTPKPGEPTPPYPTPEVMPTALPPVPGACAPPGGSYLCGSRSTPRANCGHCKLNYNKREQWWSCDFQNRAETWGTAYAIDISMKRGQPILLPPIDGQNVTWYHYKATANGIQKYRSNVNRKAYIINFHHTTLGSGIGIGKEAQSGQVGARVCQEIGCDHVHIQVNQDGWKSATSYYCFP